MGKLIEWIFMKVYLSMLASGLFLLLSFSGGLVLGIGPASMTVMSLAETNGEDYKSYRIKEAWRLFRSNFIRGNQMFYSFFSLLAVFLYGIYLMVQLPNQSLFYLSLTLLNLFLALLLPLLYTLYLKIQVHFELSYLNGLKLSFISLFLTPPLLLLKLVIGFALLVLVGWYAPALAVFVLLGMWHFFVNDTLAPLYSILESHLES
ncbi:hypothetical protein STRDD10_01659 [Streptococcus sp. DD10]|uniref:DUF624 domain-containing protein n=1 Tax=Streptococcus sp. DD10 TaxID=1777878 RepID=UPI000791A372|nr:DUF624 domain-containing protein [Streptococcus sp. DD10]KXT73029.1 hypothetical protein STRDD10_01659 [Streptococcus sp. DD10]